MHEAPEPEPESAPSLSPQPPDGRSEKAIPARLRCHAPINRLRQRCIWSGLGITL